jgi:hypothetical protein
MQIYVLDDLAPTQDVELERVIEVHPLILFFWAHLAVHIHDELLMAM